VYNVAIEGISGVFFINRLGGTSKTFTQNLTLNRLCLYSYITLAVASIGIVVTLLLGGQTVYLRFTILVRRIGPKSIYYITKTSKHAELIRRISLIF